MRDRVIDTVVRAQATGDLNLSESLTELAQVQGVLLNGRAASVDDVRQLLRGVNEARLRVSDQFKEDNQNRRDAVRRSSDS